MREPNSMIWYGMVWYTLFKSKKHASPNNTQLVSMEGVRLKTTEQESLIKLCVNMNR